MRVCLLFRKVTRRRLEDMTLFLIVLGLALLFEGGQCQEREVLVAQGSVAVLPCEDEFSTLSYPTAVYWSKIVNGVMKTVWRRQKSGLEFRPVRDPPRANCPVPNFGKADYSLHIAGTTYEDGGQYVCEVVGKTQMVKIVTLRVIRASFSPAIVVEGSRTEAMCDVSPGTKSAKVNWKRNGEFIRRTSLSSVSQRDAGNWTCQVSHNGVVVEATVSLQVKGIATPQDDSSVVYAAVGSPVSLPCLFTDGLIPNTVRWNRISSTTQFSHLPPSFFNGSSASATIRRVEDGDEGTYKCSGVMEGLNRERIQVQRRMELVVSRVVSSSASSGNGPVTLTCHLSNSNQITSYEWLRVTYGPNDTQTVTSVTSVQKTNSFRIQKVTERDAGEWVCRYYGKQGVLGNVTYELHIMGAVKGEKSSSGNKTAMVMGLGFLFLVVFLIMFQMYRNYRRKKRILLYPAMETIVHQAATEREHRERSRPKMTEPCVGQPKTVCV
ncbi:basement membrane-specific heparan sulfate proteoglycan core protein-like [Megalobrama amblycephala]|uniref:basement membrane-specific heparan sulfate proteoglycan core protein-like n=1 Tax=Megalobrama amblycephala TaxID=75352 RepID=UPI002013FB2E|nr:basement membrane-specific heparan sulfate proteoglycan core protein-like [Megalobrama amblycephala]